jgi:2-octaprenyl-6-methoxyphenol hydroxylase
MSEQYDVVVAGGGPVGAAAALELKAAGLSVLLIEAREGTTPGRGFRPLALSHGSRLILERLGVWDRLAPATPIQRIHVSQRGRFGRTVLDAAQAGFAALGYVLDYGVVVEMLDTAVEKARVPILRGTRASSIAHDAASARVDYEGPGGAGECIASVVVIADGTAEVTGIDVRVTDYGQSALVARIGTDLGHGNMAYERFTPEGPVALLPYEDGYALVWTTYPERAEALCGAPPEAFLSHLQAHFGERAGRFTAVSARSVQPLKLRVASGTTFGRAALIGNAAQALHPVAGQGFNLGLRDAWELAAEIEKRGVQDPAPLSAYRARRRIDRAGGIAFTHALVKVFSNDNAALGLARGLGLTLVDSLPPVKDFVVRRMVFGARGT